MIVEGDKNREKLIYSIKQLGYNEYFNFEIDKDSIDNIHKWGLMKFSDLVSESPSIGIFDTDILKKEKEYTNNNIQSYSEYNKLKNREKEYVETLALKQILKNKNCFDKNYFINNIFNICGFLTKKDIQIIIENISTEALFEYLNEGLQFVKNLNFKYHGFKFDKEKVLKEYQKNINWVKNLT